MTPPYITETEALVTLHEDSGEENPIDENTGLPSPEPVPFALTLTATDSDSSSLT